MLINMRKKFLFVHIPKTGGQTIRKIIQAQNRSDDPEMDKTTFELGGMTKHLTYDSIKLKVPPVEEYFSFAFVRNPWDRIYSEWMYLKTWPDKKGHKELLADSKTFTLFLHRVKYKLAKTKYVASNHWRSQSDFISPEMSRVCRFENYEEEVRTLLTELGFIVPEEFASDGKIIKRNAAHRKPDWKQDFTDEAIEMISEIWAEDITNFGYKWEDLL